MEALESTEHFANDMKAHGKTCMGCIRHESDFMLSYTDSNGEIIDLFMTTDAVVRLKKQIEDQLKYNLEDDTI